MLKKRIIPVLLIKNKTLIKDKQFAKNRRVGSLLPAIKIYNNRQVDELILLDIQATNNNRCIDASLINEISKSAFFPFCVGGGINNCESIKKLLAAGADKVSINTAAYENISFIKSAVSQFGSQCIIISIDVKKIHNEYFCFSHCGTKNTGYKLTDWLKIIDTLNVGELLITSIDHDGTMIGYDKDLIHIMNEQSNIPFIISRGCSSYEDMSWVFNNCGANAVAASSIFHFTRQTPLEAKKYLLKKNIKVRPVFIVHE